MPSSLLPQSPIVQDRVQCVPTKCLPCGWLCMDEQGLPSLQVYHPTAPPAAPIAPRVLSQCWQTTAQSQIWSAILFL